MVSRARLQCPYTICYVAEGWERAGKFAADLHTHFALTQVCRRHGHTPPALRYTTAVPGTFYDSVPASNHLTWHFWATVCKTVRPTLSDRCPVCLSVLSVTLVYCGQTVGWIKMKLGMHVGLGAGHIVLDGDPAPPSQKGHSSPIFSPYLLQPNGWMDQDATWYGGRPRPRRLCVGT